METTGLFVVHVRLIQVSKLTTIYNTGTAVMKEITTSPDDKFHCDVFVCRRNGQGLGSRMSTSCSW